MVRRSCVTGGGGEQGRGQGHLGTRRDRRLSHPSPGIGRHRRWSATLHGLYGVHELRRLWSKRLDLEIFSHQVCERSIVFGQQSVASLCSKEAIDSSHGSV
eukprot:scaffold64205_cov28-Tisochrysis_lutea.AAC.2